MNNQISLPEEKILSNLCEKYGIRQELIRQLLIVERGYQDHAKRRGIYQQISDLIRADMSE
jgi:hypothetical protein